VFEHIPATTLTRSEMLGRVDRETSDLGGKRRSFTFITWNAAFRTSGIAEGVSIWKGGLLGTAGGHCQSKTDLSGEGAFHNLRR
jgi:hypothetical protein